MESSLRNRKASDSNRKRPTADFDLNKPIDRYSRFNQFLEDDGDLDQKGFFNTSFSVLLFSIGCGFLMYLSKNYSKYIKDLHENMHWFSSIQVKRV